MKLINSQSGTSTKRGIKTPTKTIVPTMIIAPRAGHPLKEGLRLNSERFIILVF